MTKLCLIPWKTQIERQKRRGFWVETGNFPGLVGPTFE